MRGAHTRSNVSRRSRGLRPRRHAFLTREESAAPAATCSGRGRQRPTTSLARVAAEAAACDAWNKRYGVRRVDGAGRKWIAGHCQVRFCSHRAQKNRLIEPDTLTPCPVSRVEGADEDRPKTVFGADEACRQQFVPPPKKERFKVSGAGENFLAGRDFQMALSTALHCSYALQLRSTHHCSLLIAHLSHSMLMCPLRRANNE